MKKSYGGKKVGDFISNDNGWNKEAFKKRPDPWEISPKKVEFTKEDKEGFRTFVVVVLNIFLLVMWYLAFKKSHWNYKSEEVWMWSFLILFVNYIVAIIEKSSRARKKKIKNESLLRRPQIGTGIIA